MHPERTPARRRPRVAPEVDATHAKRTLVGPGRMGLEIGQALTEGARHVREAYDLPTESDPAGPQLADREIGVPESQTPPSLYEQYIRDVDRR